MAWLPDSEKFYSLFVLTQLTNVADTQRQTDRQTDRHHMTTSHRAAKTSSASHVNFDSFVVFMCLISIQNILKGNLLPKFKGTSVWRKLTAVITGVIFTCPYRAGF